MKKYVKSNESFKITLPEKPTIVTDEVLEDVDKVLRNGVGAICEGPYTTSFQNCFNVDIIWGDWKHDHLRADYLIKEYFKKLGYEVSVNEEVTEEDGSDTYSATHYYSVY